jgi:hypothetical protein
MKKAMQVYVLTLNAPSRKAIRLWTGASIDVGPVTRQFLTRADDFIDGVEGLTLCNKLARGQVPERAM